MIIVIQMFTFTRYTTLNFKNHNDVCCTNRSCEYSYLTWKLVAAVTRYITKAMKMKQILTWILRRKEAMGVAVDLHAVSFIAIIIQKINSNVIPRDVHIRAARLP